MSAVCKFDLAAFNEKWSDDERNDLIFLARTAEAAERYDDMCCCMKKVVTTCKEAKDDMTVDERNLLSVAYKNVIGARRASWRTINAEAQDEKNSNLIQQYKKQLEVELKSICNEVLGLLEDTLIKQDKIEIIKKEAVEAEKKAISDGNKAEIKTSVEGEAQVFYLKMAGDYYRYLAEAVTSADAANEKKSAQFYKQAFELSEKVLEPTHPIRLGLALNYSVCFYEILKDKKKACQLAKDAFDEAISKLDKLEESDYKDSTLIMQLLRDNLTLWTSSDSNDGDNDDDSNQVTQQGEKSEDGD